MIEKRIKQTYDAIRPQPGAAERIRHRLDTALGTPMSERTITVKPRRQRFPGVISAAAVLFLLIGGAALLLWPRLFSKPAPVPVTVPDPPPAHETPSPAPAETAGPALTDEEKAQVEGLLEELSLMRQLLEETEYAQVVEEFGEPSLARWAEESPDGVVRLCGRIGTYAESRELTEQEILGLTLADRGLDGADAEAYAALLAKLHRLSPAKLDEALRRARDQRGDSEPAELLAYAEPGFSLDSELALISRIYSALTDYLSRSRQLDYGDIAPLRTDMKLSFIDGPVTEAVTWLDGEKEPAWVVLVPIMDDGGKTVSGRLRVYGDDSGSIVGESFQEDPVPLMTVGSGENTVEPYPVKLDEPDWTAIVRQAADEIPTLTLKDDFRAQFRRGTRKSNLQIYDGQLTLLREYWYGDTAALWLEPGSYYGVIEVYGPWSRTVSSDVYRCVFRLSVPESGPSPFRPAELRGLTEARLRCAGGEYVLQDADSLARLEDWLTNAQLLSTGTACPFGSVLTLTCADGSVFTCCPAEDSCGVVFANGSYYRFAHGNEEFLQLFGVGDHWSGGGAP